MFAVGVGRVLFPSAGEANSYFGEEMARTFRERKSFDTHFCQWLVSISLHSTFRNQKYRFHALQRALDELGLHFVSNIRTTS